jgi:hypothetical protein
MKKPNMSRASQSINFAGAPLSNRGAVTAINPRGACRPERTFTSLAATMKQAAKRAIMAGLLVASLLIGAVSFAAVVTAKGQEGGAVCTGTQMAADTCQPMALQSTPIGSVPLGCKPSSNDTVACGRLSYHESAAPALSAGSAENGPAQALATRPGTHSGVTASAQPHASRHAAR